MKRFVLSIYLFFITFFINLSASNLESTNQAEEKSNKSGRQTQAGSEEAENTLKIGILAFPVSQQPNGMVSFGQNIVSVFSRHIAN